MSPDSQRPWMRELRRSYRRAMSRTTLEAVIAVGARLLPVWLALLVIGMLVTPTPVLAWVLAAASWIVGLGAIVWAVLRIHKRRAELVSFAAWLEERAGLGENEFVNALDLERMPSPKDPLARHIVGRVVKRAQTTHEGLPLTALFKDIKLTGPLALGLGSVAVGVLLFWLSPVSFHRSVTALSAPGTITPPVVLIDVEPGNVSLERGDNLDVAATIDSPSEVAGATLLVRGADGVWRPCDMSSVDSVEESRAPAETPGGKSRSVQRFTHRLEDLQAGVTYLVSTGSTRSPEYQVEIREPLRALGYRKILDWPAYSRLSRLSEISSHGDLSALPGSRATLQVTPTRPKAEGKLAWSSGEAMPLRTTDEGQLEAAWTISRADTYRVVLEDSLGARWVSDPYLVTLLEDQPPVLRVVAPAGDTMVPPEMQVLLDVECVDDYGLGELTLVYSRAWEPPQREQLGHWDGTREARVTHPWDLEDLGLLPGQDVTFYFELTDNDDVSGPKVTRSQIFTIRFPSMAEMYAQLEQERRGEIQDLSEMLEDQEKLQDDLEEISRELMKESDLSWEKQQEVQKLVEQQKELAERLDEITQSLDQSLRNMQENSLFTPDMIEKLQQIRDLVSEIQSEEFQEYLEAMQRAVENLDRDSLQKAMEQFKFTQEDIRQGLDRTLELLQRLLAEEKLGRLLQEVERLTMEQKALNEKLEEGLAETDLAQAETEEALRAEDESEGDEAQGDEAEGDEGESGETESDQEACESGGEQQDQEGSPQESGELSQEELDALRREQERLAEEAKRLQEMFDELQQMSQEMLDQLAEMMEQMQQQNHLEQAQQDMQQAQQSMQQGKQERSLRFGRQAQQNLQNLLSALMQAQAALQQGLSEEVTRQLFALSNQLVHISKTQEVILTNEGKFPTDRLAVEEQALLEGTRGSLDSLFAIARKTPVLSMGQARLMGEAVRKMGESVNYFERGRRSPAVGYAQESAAALDEALRQLLDAQSSMCMNQSGNPNSSCMNKMAGLGSQQSQLNRQTQQLLGQGKRITPSQNQQVLSLAARQEMIKKGLQEVSEEVGSQRDILGRLDDMVNEMEEIAQEMRRRGVDEPILRRQERILSRLLTAQRSIRRQDQREERISRPGENPAHRDAPPPLSPQVTRREQILRGILRGGQDPIPADYRQLVEEYWKALMANP